MAQRARKLAEAGSIDYQRDSALAVLKQFSSWPSPQPGQTFADILEAMPRVEGAFMELAEVRMRELLADAPFWLTADEKRRAAAVIEDGLLQYAGAAPLESLLWTLAADLTRPQPRGNRPVWVGPEGRMLRELVDTGLRLKGWRRSDPKAVLRIVAEIRESLPARYGAWSEERLRKAYYEATEQSGKASN